MFCNSLKYKDNPRYRLEAGAPRKDIFNNIVLTQAKTTKQTDRLLQPTAEFRQVIW